MTTLTPQEAADSQRAEAKELLNSLFPWGKEGTSSGAVDRIVDCIIGAALIESALLQRLNQLSAKSE